MNNADVLIKFKGDTKNADEAIKETDKKLKDFESTGKTVFSALTLAADAFAISIISAGVDYNAEIETYLTRLETLTGSAENANKILEQIKKDALATPFDVSSLTQAESLLLSTGLSAEQVRLDVLALGDAISASGGGNAELQRMAVNMQQIKNVGKASALDIKQFAYAGIDIYGLLADSMGVTREEASQMTVTYDMLSTALQKASQKGGKYYNAMEKQSKTYKGAMSNLKESVNVFAGDMAEEFFKSIKKIIPKLTDLFNWLSKNKEVVIAIAKPILILSNTILGLLAINKVTSAFGGLWKIITAHPIAIATAAIVSLTAAIIGLVTQETEAERQHRETMDALKQEASEIDAAVQSWDDLQAARQNNINVGMTELAYTKALYDELTTLVDENGNVIEGYEDRADFITGELAKALGIEIQYTDGQIQGYKELQEEIDKIIEKKKAQIILNASEELYTEALKNQLEAQDKLNKEEAIYLKEKEEFQKILTEGSDLDKMGVTKRYKAAKEEYEIAKENYNNQRELVEGYYYEIGKYEKNYEYFHNEEYDKMSTATWEYAKDVQKAGDAEKATLEKNITVTKSTLNTLYRLKEQSGSDIYDQQIKTNEALLNNQEKELKKYTSTTETNLNQTKDKWGSFLSYAVAKIKAKNPEVESAGKDFVKGFGNGIDDNPTKQQVLGKVYNFADSVLGNIKRILGIHSPSTEMEQIGEYFMQGFSVGIQNEKNKVFGDLKTLTGDLLSNANIGLNGSVMASMNTTNSPIINVYANFSQDQLGQVVRDIKTFSGGARNDYNYGIGG